MATHTDNVTSPCEVGVVYALDVLDARRRLAVEHVPFTDDLASCGCGPRKCGLLAKWINKLRIAAGKQPLGKDAIKPTTTIGEVIGHVC